MSSLVTDLSPEELAELQADQEPVPVPLPKKLIPARQGTKEIFGWGWGSGEFPEGTRIEMLPPEGDGSQRCEVFHEPPYRFERAKGCQPEPGEKHFWMPADSEMILRMEDGSMVHRVNDDGGRGMRYRLLPDSPIAPEE